MTQSIFRPNTPIKHVVNGRHGMVIETIPYGLKVIYRIEYENGQQSLVDPSQVRIDMSQVQVRES